MIASYAAKGGKKCIDVVFSGESRWPLDRGLIKRFKPFY